MIESKKKLVLVLNDTRVDLHHGCHRVMTCIDQEFSRNGNANCIFIPAHQVNMLTPAIRELIKKSQLVLINGEGTFHHDSISGKKLLDVGLYAKSLGKKVAFINATWQGNSVEALSALAEFDYVAVRESLSGNELMAAGVKHKVVPDLSLYNLEPNIGGDEVDVVLYGDSVKRKDASVLLGQCLGDEAGEFFPISLTYNSFLDGLRLLRRQYCRLDLKSVRRLRQTTWLSLNIILRKINKHDDFLKKLSQSCGVVSGRFHLVCMAIGLSVPFLCMESNSHKIQGLLIDVGLEGRMVDKKDIKKRIKNIKFSECELRKIERYREVANMRISLMFEDIGRLLG